MTDLFYTHVVLPDGKRVLVIGADGAPVLIDRVREAHIATAEQFEQAKQATAAEPAPRPVVIDIGEWKASHRSK